MRARRSCFSSRSLFSAPRPPNFPNPFARFPIWRGAAPPEFAADALLRIVESGKLAGQERPPRTDRAGVPARRVRQISSAHGGPARHHHRYRVGIAEPSLRAKAGRAVAPKPRCTGHAAARSVQGARAFRRNRATHARAAHLRRCAGLRACGLLPGLERRGQWNLHSERESQRGARQFAAGRAGLK